MKIATGINPDGTTIYGYVQVDVNGVPVTDSSCDRDNLVPIVATGPITGKVKLPDGTTYNVTEPFIDVAPGHEGLVSCAIGQRYETEGHPFHEDDQPFLHLCTDFCGETKRAEDHPGQAAAIAQAVEKINAIPDVEHRAEVAEAHGLAHLVDTSSGAV